MTKYVVVPQKSLTDKQRAALGSKYLAFSYRKGDTVYFCVCGLDRPGLEKFKGNIV
ncbi:hypothetical protein VPMG_00115 [Vibrio phage VBP32]|uniref:Uncharacterized protein n=2 Tax=Stoningtonvirus VBP47 TaxID=2846606 RepID=M4T359_9CAUD|nr:hypothetical protein VPNG_00014 [Vibrio phage VBP47]YP_007676491.1 hypothetical protein VPMG_00001 [Vibrio phage VBP32]YP_007676605.1 hypothetical protein VPMG_00115 [Vibrio phage VBP32]AGH57038.1 hypothetical protein VPNG_00014 [Vibrio phage VBP47]AGH57140.1 hypothetical protein VPMG_00001 [Vibrio phage VBP32]AGH57254.1 hypothetical protein VPMG_00115 [Vibrio phage VBP32]